MDRSFLDLLRARAEGRLTREEREQLERELAADRSLLALAEDFALVHSLTAADPASAAAAQTRFEDIERHLGPRRLARRIAAVAAVLAAIGGAYWLGRSSRTSTDAPLCLWAIELDAPLVSAASEPDLPEQWADYDPRGETGVRFLSDLAEAELLAHEVQRPLLVYGTYPGCPLAAALDAKVFSDPAVSDLAERTVPVRLNLAAMSEAEQRALTVRGYPFLEVWRDDGRPTHSLARNPDAKVFVESLHDGLAKSDATGELLPWEDLRGAARSFVTARTGELEGRLAEAERGYRALAQDPVAPGAIAERARGGLLRLSGSARALLVEARVAASGDVAEAMRLLEQGVKRFAGTSFEADLRKVRERLARDGRFPPLAEADRST